MTRTEHIPPNPNHYVGNHPLINSDQLDQYYPSRKTAVRLPPRRSTTPRFTRARFTGNRAL